METRKLGKNGPEVSKLAIGCWSFGGDSYWGSQEQKDVDEVVHEAIEQFGINFFDNAFGYPGSEEALGKASAGIRDKMLICDKLVLNSEIGRQEEQLKESLRRLNTDYIDIYMIHWPVSNKSYVIKVLEWMDTLRQAGIIRYIGVSNFGIQQLGWVKESGVEIIADQLVYSILTRAVEYAIVPYCAENDIGIMGYMPIMQGLLAGKYKNIDEMPPQLASSKLFTPRPNQTCHHGAGCEKEAFAVAAEIVSIAGDLGINAAQLSLAWAIEKKGITSAIVGCRNLKQLGQNAASAALKLDNSVIKRIDDLSQQVKEYMGDSPDIYMDASESRIY